MNSAVCENSGVSLESGSEGQMIFSAVYGTQWKSQGRPCSLGLRDGKDRGISLLSVGHSENPGDSPVLRTKGWEGQMLCVGHSGNPRDSSVLGTKGWEDVIAVCGTQWKSCGLFCPWVGQSDGRISLLCMGHSGNPGDSSKEWEGQRVFSTCVWGFSGTGECEG